MLTRTLVVIALALAACSGSGNRDTFAPAANVNATHGHLMGAWYGLGQPLAGGHDIAIEMTLNPANVVPSVGRVALLEINGTDFIFEDEWQADGDRIKVAARTGYGGYDFRARCDLRLQADSLVGNYVIYRIDNGDEYQINGGAMTLGRSPLFPARIWGWSPPPYVMWFPK